MNRFISTRSLVASAIALGAVLSVSAAQARTDLTVVVDMSARNAQPVPVQYQQFPARTVERQPYIVQADQGRDRFERDHGNDRFERDNGRSGPMGDADRDGVPNRFDRDSRFFDARATYRHAQWGDFDRDGVPNQFDRAPHNPRRH